MDRTYWCELSQLLPGETTVLQQRGVRLYDGDERTEFDSGRVQLTTHRVLWDDEEQEGRTLAVDLSLMIKTDTTSSSFTRSAKVKLYFVAAPAKKSPGPSLVAKADYIQLSFRKGGQEEFYRILKRELANKPWEKTPAPPPGGLKLRAGIVGIERGIEKKQRDTDKQVNQAFKDLDALIDKAKDMVGLVNKFAAKMEDKKGSVSEDETVQFKSYLLSVGISNPVTRETHGSGSAYHKELAKQIASFLTKPLQEADGIMTMADVYCRFNRARGMELVSPDDLVNACLQFEPLKLPMRMKKFDSGVLVVQSLSHSEEAVVEETIRLVKERESLTAEELSRLAKVSIMLATERLLVTEKSGGVCRDESVEGLRFYDNKFLEQLAT